MFQWLIRFSVTHKVVVGVFTLALIVWGVLSLIHLPFDSTPDITSNQVQIITTAPSLGAQEVEQTVTTPIEAAMANIPRVKERRSISRSGLSVITLVFDEGADIYWAREQVNQALGEVKEDFPSSKADTELAPISTGLGEIYHYTVRAAPGYENRYSLSDLREIQDWIVRRRLAGTQGVAEVSGWGGFVREYEVKVDPRRLAAAGITMADLADALESNNENNGGSYIEKNSSQYFIRGLGRVESAADIENITVGNAGGRPLTVKDVADVGFGHATRYGAVTRNGEGEVVAGIALMLKGENFQEVSRNVKDRLDEIRKTLPEGIVVEPFIDRTDLVDRVTSTIERNLVEGGLIVVLILVLFLGSLRAGLVVASVIPLAMLFAFGMMKLTGVSGNLMSLGALDFGLIVDGAVIIVESVMARLHFLTNKRDRELTRREMDEEVTASASKIRNSAAFGEIIIMIVYLPLLTLSGIEGKMFRPMALTIFYAVLGAFILSLTYVPMASALFLSRKPVMKRNFSDTLMDVMHRLYRPVLDFCLRNAVAVTVMMTLAFGGAVWLFTRMGGEFIPTLEEGDFAVEISMVQGTSLSQMVEATTLGEKLLKEQFPEIKQIVTRIGSAEIPTDPMPVERADMLVSLVPKKDWKSAKTTAELMEKMEETLSVIPGMEAEMSQPVQMRNNELITGIRQDVAVMIYGPDLDVLSRKAGEVAGIIRDIPGVGTPKVEEVKGLPQIQVEYDRKRLGTYGVTVAMANEVVETAFAGRKAGKVYEGDRAFDVVIRAGEDLRNDIESVRNLPVPLPGGGTVPLEAVANVEYRDAPAQITHDDGERRIYVGFNVRGRDMQSTVNDVREALDKNLRLPAGYRLEEGGEFKNLQEATGRLGVAVPIALALILVLLYATLRSIKETLMVFTAIPLSLIGGVVALYMRAMPFSISAGVGFIALFGVAVLNGIVLMGQFNTFEKEGITDVRKRIVMGCQLRLRPVIMTALVASFGFLPMALSTGDGAEVQRPLATVVIGGLLTATILTLMVIPAIYKLVYRDGNK